MERRAASHTEEEEMNQRRRLLNAAKKGDQKAVAKLFELYQVRVYNNEMVTKLNRTAGTHKLQAEVAQAKAASKGGLFTEIVSEEVCRRAGQGEAKTHSQGQAAWEAAQEKVTLLHGHT